MMNFDYVMAFLKAKRDAPNYREATDKEMKAKKNCGTCKAWDSSATDDPKTGFVSGTISTVWLTIFVMRG